MRFVWLVAGSFIALATGTPSWAADMAAKAPVYKAAVIVPTYNWSGFYLGGHLGYLWGRTRVEENGVLTEPNAATDGVIGGVLGGYNWQNGALVLGVEGDFGWTNAHGTGAVIQIVTELPNTYDINWTSHARGRIGYASNQWLFFVAGGLAIADFAFHEGGEVVTFNNVVPGATFTGGSIGGGVEYAFNPWLLGRIEYLYDDFGHKTYTNADGDSYRVGLTGHTLRGALSVKFGP